MEAVEWLDDVEARAWRALVVASTRLKAVLDAELMATHGLSFGDYEVLVVLSETPARRLRMSELGRAARPLPQRAHPPARPADP